MGIKDLHKLLAEHAKDGIYEVPLEELSGYRIAVDVSIYLNKYVKTSGEKYWIDNFMQMLCSLKNLGITAVCIFDGPNPPEEKRQEQERRRDESASKKDQIAQAKTLLERALGCMPKPLPSDYLEELTIFLTNKKHEIYNIKDSYCVVSGLREMLKRWEKQNTPIIPDYTKMAMEFARSIGLVCHQAHGEAEKLCAALCCHGLVGAVLTEDTDVLAYGAPMMICKLDLQTEKARVIHLPTVLKKFGKDDDDWNYEQFRDLCIMLQCDYNKRVKGIPPGGKKVTSIGAKKAYDMIDAYKSIEGAEDYIEDIRPLKHVRCRELFSVTDKECMDIVSYYKKKGIHCSPLDFTKVKEFYVRYKPSYSMDEVLKSRKTSKITITSVKTNPEGEDDE